MIILKAVNIYAHAKSEEEKLIEAGETLGLGKLTPEQAAKLRNSRPVHETRTIENQITI